MASSSASLPANTAGVDIAAAGHHNSWIAFEDDPAGFEDVGLRTKRSSRTSKHIKRTTVHRTSSAPHATQEGLDNRQTSGTTFEGVDNYYDYSAVQPIEPRAVPVRQVSDESDPYVMRPDVLVARDQSLKSPDPDFEGGGLFTSQNRTISTSNSSSGSSNERNKGRRERAHKTGSSNASPPQQTAASPRAIAIRGASVDSSTRRGRPSSRTTASQRSATPSSKSRTSVRSHSQSHAQSTTARSSATTTTTRSHSRSSASRQSQPRGRSNSSSHQRPPPTRNNHLDRRSRSRSRSASLTRVVNGPSSAADTTSVAARSVPSRLPTHNSGTGIATGFTSSLTPRSAYSTTSRNHRQRGSTSQSPGGRAARSIGPGVSYETRRRGGTQDGIAGLEFVFPGSRTSNKVGEGSVSKEPHRGAKTPKLSFMDKIFGESQSNKVKEVDHSKYVFRSRTLLAATVYHNSATNLWITTINTNQRGVARDPATANRHLRAFSFASEREAREAAIANAPPKMMTDDESHNQCVLCQQTFGIFRRSAHCRNCGVCVCMHATCSMTWSAKAVPETYNLKNETNVRVCKSCDSLSHKFQAALLDGSYEDAVALYGTGNVNLRTPFPTRSRREEVLFPVHAAVEGGNIDILRWLVEDHYCPVQIIKAGKPSTNSVSVSRASYPTPLSSSGRSRVPILTSKGRSVLSIAMDGARVQILRYLVVECSVSVHESTNLQSCLRSLEAALMFMTPPAVTPLATQIPFMSSPTAHHHNKTRPSSTRSGSVRFHDDDVESETEDPSEPTSEDADADEPTTVLVSSRAGVDEVEVESRHSSHTRGSKSRTSHRSTKSKMSTRSAPVSRSHAANQESCGGTCILCMDRPVEVTGIPCGHEISCSACNALLLACPVCGGPSAPPPPPRRPRSASASSSSSWAPTSATAAVVQSVR